MNDVFKHLGWFFKQEYKKYIIAGIALIVLSALNVVPARILGLVIEEIANRTINSNKMIVYSLLLLLIPLTRYLVNIVYHYTVHLLGQKVSFELREKYIDHLFDLDANTYAKYTKGDLIARATNDLQNLTTVATSFLQTVIFNFGIIIFSVAVMVFTIDPFLTLACIIIMPVSIFILNNMRIKKRQYYKIHHEFYADMTEKVLESIEGVKTVRAYCEEENDFIKTKKAIDADVNSWRKILKFESAFTPMFEFVYAFSYFIAFALGSYMVITSRITTGDLLTFVMYIGLLYGPLIALSNVLNFVNNATISDNRYYEIMNIEPEIKNTMESLDILTFDKIEFKNVSFKYPFDEMEVIQNIDLVIRKGETIGIVGPTGAGKSTLIRQLLREFNVTNGEVLIDDVDIKNYKIEDVHALVGYVPQSHILFRKTVDENILVGDPEATNEEIEKAFIVSDFKKDIKELVFGRETIVGELGNSLSGGQKQRLSIARALVKNPDILILDDSLSAVDALTESTIIQNLQVTRKDKTNIIVAHRFSAIQNADKIIVIQNGKITDVGTHKELLKYDNWYKMQYLEQLGKK